MHEQVILSNHEYVLMAWIIHHHLYEIIDPNESPINNLSTHMWFSHISHEKINEHSIYSQPKPQHYHSASKMAGLGLEWQEKQLTEGSLHGCPSLGLARPRRLHQDLDTQELRERRVESSSLSITVSNMCPIALLCKDRV
ncbi:hypothetical protein CDL15_Pgr017985 [Punica granatum]|uniref:Uncharacterized protein n=1 Tax=Punica granatum TaxID=22663 RepID=A0A218WJ84_PUNGR|nr:hypothetical protein CDL15_Pgr017985 [Punica granatum]